MKGNIKIADAAIKDEEKTGYENNPQLSLKKIEALVLEGKTQEQLKLLSKRVYELQGEKEESFDGDDYSWRKRYSAQKKRIRNLLD